MIATLKFDLTDEDDRHAYKLANMASDMSLVIWHMKDKLRSQLKYETLSDDVYEALEKIQTELFEALENYNVNLDDL